MQTKRFSDFAEGDGPLEGDKVKIDSILNQEILITGYKIRNSKYRKEGTEQYLTIQFQIDEHERILFTGSNVLIDQLEKYKDNLPFYTTIKKVDRYYTFT